MLESMAYLPSSLAPSLPLDEPVLKEQTVGPTFEAMVGMERTGSTNKHDVSHGIPTTFQPLQPGNEMQKQIPSVSKAGKKTSPSHSSSSPGNERGSRNEKIIIESNNAENTGETPSSKKKAIQMFSGKLRANAKMSSAAAQMLDVSDKSLTLDALENVPYNAQRRRAQNENFPLHIEEDVALRSEHGTNETAITAPISDRTFQSSHFHSSMDSSLMRSHGSSQKSSKFLSLMGSLRQESLRVLQEGQNEEEGEIDEAEKFQKWTESIRVLQEETYHPSLKREELHSSEYSAKISEKKVDRKGETGSTPLCDPSLDSFFDIMYGTSDGAEKSKKDEEILWGAIEKLLIDSSCSVDSRENNDRDIPERTSHKPQLHVQKHRNWGDEAAKKQPALLKAVTFMSQHGASIKEKRVDGEVESPRDRPNEIGDVDEDDRSIKKAKHALNNVMNVLVSTMDSHDDDETTSSYQSQASTHIQELRQTMTTHQYTLHDLFRWSLRKGKRYVMFEEGVSIGERQSSVLTNDTDQCVASDSGGTKASVHMEEEEASDIEASDASASPKSSNKKGLVLASEDEMTDISDASFTPHQKVSNGSSDTSEVARWLEKGFSTNSDESDFMNWAKSKSSSDFENTSSIGTKSDEECNIPTTGGKKSITFNPTLTAVAEGGYCRSSPPKLHQVDKGSKRDDFYSEYKITSSLPRLDDGKLIPNSAARPSHGLENEVNVDRTRRVRIAEEEENDHSSSSSSDPEIEVRSNVSSMVSSLTGSSFTISSRTTGQDGQKSSTSKDLEISTSKEANGEVDVAATVHVAASFTAQTPVGSENKDNQSRGEPALNIDADSAYPVSTSAIYQENESRPFNSNQVADGDEQAQKNVKDFIFLNRRISELDVLRQRSSEMLDKEEINPANDLSTDALEPVSYTFEGEQHIIVIDTGEGLEETLDEGTLPLASSNQERKLNQMDRKQYKDNSCIDRNDSSSGLEESGPPGDPDNEVEKEINNSDDKGSSARSERYLILATDRKSFRRIQKSKSIRIAEVVPIKNQSQIEEGKTRSEKNSSKPVEYHGIQKKSLDTPIAMATPVVDQQKNDLSSELAKKAPPDLGPVEKKQYLLFLEDEGSTLQRRGTTPGGEHFSYGRYDMASVPSLENLFYANYPLGDVVEILPEELNPLPTDELTVDSFVLAESSGIQQPSHRRKPQKEEKRRRSSRRGSVGKFADSCLLFVNPAKNFCKVGTRKINKRNTRKSKMSYNEWKSNNQMK